MMQTYSSKGLVQGKSSLHFRSSAIMRANKNQESVPNASFGKSIVKNIAVATMVTTIIASPAITFAKQLVGEFDAGGLFFKDQVEVIALDDPEVEGVVLYLTEMQRNSVDKFKNFFSDPTLVSLGCSTSGYVNVKNLKKIQGTSGKDVFSEAKQFFSLFQNKEVKIRRVLDDERKTLIYVAYTTRNTNQSAESGSSRYKTSTCAIPLQATKTDIENVPISDESAQQALAAVK